MAKEITQDQVNAASSGVLIFAHSIEKFVKVIEEYYFQQFQKRPEYKKTVDKMYAKHLMDGVPYSLALRFAQRDAEAYIRKVNREAMETESDVRFVEFLKTVASLREQMEAMSELGMEANSLPKGEKYKAFDLLMKDSDMMCRVFSEFQNLEDSEGRAEAYIRTLKEKDIVSDEFMDEWYRMNV